MAKGLQICRLAGTRVEFEECRPLNKMPQAALQPISSARGFRRMISTETGFAAEFDTAAQAKALWLRFDPDVTSDADLIPLSGLPDRLFVRGEVDLAMSPGSSNKEKAKARPGGKKKER